jgi:non-heme chloroperoxidase
MTHRRSFLTGTGSAAALAALGTSLSPARARATPTRIKINDSVELFTKDWGSGKPIVMCHPWPFSCDVWDYHAAILAEAGYRVIAYDRRGFGRSSQPSSGYDFNVFSDDLAAVIDATGVRDVTLVGNSMGGGEIVRYLSRHGDKKVAKVGLIATIVPGLLKTKDNPKGIDAATFEGIKAGLLQDRPSFLAAFLKDGYYDVGSRSTSPATKQVLDWSLQMSMQAGLRPLLSCVDAFGKTDFREELAAIKVPTLIVHGTADKPVPIEITGRVAAARIAKAKLIEYAGGSHGILQTERDRIAKDLLAFLRS